MESDLPPARVFKRRGAIIALILLAIALLPLALTHIAGTVADQLGCVLHEGFPNECIVNGQDIGGQLYQFGLLAWYSVILLPIWYYITWLWFAISLGRAGIVAWPLVIVMVGALFVIPVVSNFLQVFVLSYREMIDPAIFGYMLTALGLTLPLILVTALVTTLFRNGFAVREADTRGPQR